MKTSTLIYSAEARIDFSALTAQHLTSICDVGRYLLNVALLMH